MWGGVVGFAITLLGLPRGSGEVVSLGLIISLIRCKFWWIMGAFMVDSFISFESSALNSIP